MPDQASLRLRLPRTGRLQQSREFASIRNSGQRAAAGCLAMNWLAIAEGQSKVGVITSRKLGKASVRSRARRLLREVFRLHQHELLGPVAVVLVARNSIVRKKFSDVERDFLYLLRQANLVRTKG